MVALTIAAGLLYGAPPAAATSPSTTSTSTTTTSTTTTSTSATTVGPTSATNGRTVPSPSVPDCNDVLAGSEQGSLTKTGVGGNAQLGFDLWRVQTDRPAAVYHVVDCIRFFEVGSGHLAIATVDLGEVQVSGAATFRVNIPDRASGEDVCDRFVLSGRVGSVTFTDVSNQVCGQYSACLFFGPGTCPPEPGVPSATPPRRGTLPFTGSAAWPLLVTAGALLGLGVASLAVARRGHHRPTR